MAKFKIDGQFLDVLSTHVQEAAKYKYRPDFPLTFSASSEDKIWPFPGYGYSKPDDRCFINHPFLRAVVREYMVVDAELGRFHVCESGVYKGEEKRLKELFIEFEPGLRFSSGWEPITQRNRALTAEDAMTIIRRNRFRSAD